MIPLGIALVTGRVDRTNAIWYSIISIVNVAGIPVIDALVNPLQILDPDEPEQYDESK